MKNNNAYEIPGFQFTLQCAADIASGLLIAVDANGNGKLAGATDATVGFSRDDRKKDQLIPVSTGIGAIVAGEAIAAGDAVMATAGKAMKHTSTNTVAGIALTSASAADEFVAVLIK